jgi:hypothetical protein
MGRQGRRRLSGTGRGTPVSLKEDSTQANQKPLTDEEFSSFRQAKFGSFSLR